ncbi:MAG TPA: hypothetical protein EYN06_02885 [Myxococcales bacterium]|nr:hypothetical protein [Myxococcales bacterium]
MKQAFLVLLFSSFGFLACSSPPGGGSGSDDGQPDVVDTDEGQGTTTGEEISEPDTKPPAQESEWTLAPHVPSDIAGKQVHDFNNFINENKPQPYFCGDGGIFRINQGSEWTDVDLFSSDRINACHAVNMDLLAAVGDQGHVWKRAGTDNWQSHDLFAEAPQLLDVWISNVTSLTVVGVAGSIYRLNVDTWEDQRIGGESATLETLWGPNDTELFAGGDNILLHYDGSTWTVEDLPLDAEETGFKIKDLTGTDKDHVWAVGDKGKVAFRDASGTWSYQDSQWKILAFNAVYALSENDVITVGDKGKARRYLGQEPWDILKVVTPKKTPLGDKWPAGQKVPPEDLLKYVGCWAADADNIWLMGSTGLFVQYNDDYIL